MERATEAFSMAMDGFVKQAIMKGSLFYLSALHSCICTHTVGRQCVGGRTSQQAGRCAIPKNNCNSCSNCTNKPRAHRPDMIQPRIERLARPIPSNPSGFGLRKDTTHTPPQLLKEGRTGVVVQPHLV
jgi:hypothetical protein